MIDGVRPQQKADRQGFAAARRRLVNRPKIARRVQIDTGLAPAAQHHPAAAEVGQAGFRIDGEIKCR